MCNENELSPQSPIFEPRADLLKVVEDMSRYDLEFLEDAILIRRNEIACKRLGYYGLNAKFKSEVESSFFVGESHFRYIDIVDPNDQDRIVSPKLHQLTRLFDMLRNLTPKEAFTRWLEREAFEDWQIRYLPIY